MSRGKQVNRNKHMRKFACHHLPNGAAGTADLVPSGFSDDNARGHVIAGIAGAPPGGVTMAMYESCDSSSPITVTDVDQLSDTRLTWMTDPVVNAVRKGLRIQKLRC